jgi:hypothetical protein
MAALQSPTQARLASRLEVSPQELSAFLRARPDVATQVKRAQGLVRREQKNRFRQLEAAAIAEGRFVPYLEPQDVGRQVPRTDGRISARRSTSAHDGPRR